MKRVFVLSGGGAKGAFQVGAMQKLFEKGIVPATLYGTSVGALNSAGYAYVGPTKLLEVWKSIEGKSDILSLHTWELLASPGVYSTQPLRQNFIDKVITGTPRYEAVVCAVSLKTGETRYTSNLHVDENEFKDMTEASASIPFIMDPVKGEWVDGGARHQTPLKKAIQDGATDITIISCNPIGENMDDMDFAPWTSSFPYFLNNGLRAIDIMEHEIFLHDLWEIMNTSSKLDGYTLSVIAPPRLLLDTLDFDPMKIRAAIQQGYDAVT